MTAPARHLPSFPGAEGHGATTVGGRVGRVVAVTYLNDAGPGSLRAAILGKGPLTIVFRVSGTIDLQSDLRIKNPFITIAGQTAPGDGIKLKRHPLMIEADEVIVRYLRMRLGDESGKTTDAISARYVKNLILDHLSASWSIDETLFVYHCEDITAQCSIVSERLYQSHHTKGGNHGFGGIRGSNRGSPHHNLIAHHSDRNPRFASGCGFTDTPAHAGGWPDLKSTEAPADTDGDGMPDAWQGRHQLDPRNPADDAQDADHAGYTNLAEYLNDTAPTVVVNQAARD